MGKIRAIGGILAFLGFLVVMGAVGNDDYHTLVLGTCCPLGTTLLYVIGGFLTMVLGLFLVELRK